MTEIDNELHSILSEYDFVQPYSLSVLGGGTANANYLVQCDDGHYVLRRRNPKYSVIEWIEYEIEYLEHISHKGIEVPVPLKNKQGKGWTSASEYVYQLSPYLDGDPFDAQNERHVPEAGAFLGRLHSALGHFKPVAVKDWPRYDDPNRMLEILQTVLADHASRISTSESATLRYVEENIKQILNNVPDNKYHALPKVTVHGDYHPANVKYRDQEICALFDFDWISLQPRMKDVVDGLIYFSGIRPALIDGGSIYSLTQGCTFDVDKSLSFIQAYQQNHGLPLQPEEVVALPFMIRARLIHSRMQALPKIPADQHIMMLTREMEIPLNWLDQYEDQLLQAIT